MEPMFQGELDGVIEFVGGIAVLDCFIFLYFASVASGTPSIDSLRK